VAPAAAGAPDGPEASDGREACNTGVADEMVVAARGTRAAPGDVGNVQPLVAVRLTVMTAAPALASMPARDALAEEGPQGRVPGVAVRLTSVVVVAVAVKLGRVVAGAVGIGTDVALARGSARGVAAPANKGTQMPVTTKTTARATGR
jgi:hypothetical protein